MSKKNSLSAITKISFLFISTVLISQFCFSSGNIQAARPPKENNRVLTFAQDGYKVSVLGDFTRRIPNYGYMIPLIFAKGDKYLGYDGFKFRIWNLEKDGFAMSKAPLDLPNTRQQVILTADGANVLGICTEDKEISFFNCDARTGETVKLPARGLTAGARYEMVLAPDQKHVVVCMPGRGSVLRYFSFPEFEPIQELDLDKNQSVYALDWKGDFITLRENFQTSRIMFRKALEVKDEIWMEFDCKALAMNFNTLSQDGKQFLYGTYDKATGIQNFHVVDLENKKEIRSVSRKMAKGTVIHGFLCAENKLLLTEPKGGLFLMDLENDKAEPRQLSSANFNILKIQDGIAYVWCGLRKQHSVLRYAIESWEPLEKEYPDNVCYMNIELSQDDEILGVNGSLLELRALPDGRKIWSRDLGVKILQIAPGFGKIICVLTTSRESGAYKWKAFFLDAVKGVELFSHELPKSVAHCILTRDGKSAAFASHNNNGNMDVTILCLQSRSELKIEGLANIMRVDGFAQGVNADEFLLLRNRDKSLTGVSVSEKKVKSFCELKDLNFEGGDFSFFPISRIEGLVPILVRGRAVPVCLQCLDLDTMKTFNLGPGIVGFEGGLAAGIKTVDGKKSLFMCDTRELRIYKEGDSKPKETLSFKYPPDYRDLNSRIITARMLSSGKGFVTLNADGTVFVYEKK